MKNILLVCLQPYLYFCGMKLKLSILFSVFTMLSMAQTANDIVLDAAKEKLGKKVKSGICFDLVDHSLSKVDRQWKKRSEGKYIYGEKIDHDEIMPGDIVVYKGCKFKSGRSVRSHVAIVYFVTEEDKNNVELIEQNTKGSKSKSIVVVNERDICEENLLKGRIEFYRPY